MESLKNIHIGKQTKLIFATVAKKEGREKTSLTLLTSYAAF